MGLGKTRAVVIGSFPLGEQDRVVTFFTRDQGKLRGVARRARRLRSRLAGALELLTLGDLVFFDGGRSELVQVDHFDVVEPFLRVREDLDRLGHAAWLVECVGRLTADRDRHVGLWTLLVRGLRALDGPAPPEHVANCFLVRCIEVLGHRPRTDRCGECGRLYPFAQPALDLGGVRCAPCARRQGGAIPASPAALAALERLRRTSWEDAVGRDLGPLDRELAGLLETYVTRLIGQPPRTPKFLREVRRLSPTTGGRG